MILGGGLHYATIYDISGPKNKYNIYYNRYLYLETIQSEISIMFGGVPVRNKISNAVSFHEPQ